MRILRHIIVFLCIFSYYHAKTQDANFTNFDDNPLYYNPGHSGIIKCMDVRLNHRSQWQKLPKGYNTSSFSSNIKFPEGLAGGIIFVSNIEGEGLLKTLYVGLNIAYHFSVSENTIVSTGIMTTGTQKSINWTKLEFDDQFDELYGKIRATDFVPPSNDKTEYMDFNSGVILKTTFNSNVRSKKNLFKTGYAIHHLLKPNQSLLKLKDSNNEKLKIKHIFNANILMWVNSNNAFYPGIIYETQDDFNHNTITIGLKGYINSYLYTGFWFRTKNPFQPNKYDAFIINMGIRSDKESSWILGFSFDKTISKLNRGAFGSIECFVSKGFNCKNRVLIPKVKNKRSKKNSIKRTKCTDFFDNW